MGLINYLWFVKGLYGGSLGTQLGGQLGKDFLCVLYIFPLCFYSLFTAREQDSRPV
jgi:hypothetical protein